MSKNNVHSFIHSGYFYSVSSSPLLFRGAPDILFRSFTPKRGRKLQVKDLAKVPTRLLERDSNPRLFGRKSMNLQMSHHAPHVEQNNNNIFVYYTNRQNAEYTSSVNG